MPEEEKNPYEAFREEQARLNISATKEVDDPEDVIQQEQIDRNRVVPDVPPIIAEDTAEDQPS